MSPTVRSTTELLVDVPAYVVHRGAVRAAATLLPEHAQAPVDGAVRVLEGGAVVPGLVVQLHRLAPAPLDLARLAPGRHRLTVAYTGGTHYEPSGCAPFEVLVLPATTVTDLVVPAGGVRADDCLGVTVRTTDSTAAASGAVRLYDCGRLLATGEVADGIGTVRLPRGLPPGMHRLFVAYAGSRTHHPSETPLVPVRLR